jgi:tetrapyrrole methylase family protein/MazG family protein
MMPPGITVVGLGPGHPDLVTRQVWRLLEQAQEIVLRTGRHPVVQDLPSGLKVTTFDALFEGSTTIDDAYQAMLEALIELGGRQQGVIYGVPGDPDIGDAVVAALRTRLPELGIPLHILHGVSYVEPTLRMANAGGVDGIYVTDALDVARRHHPPFPPDVPVIIGQLSNRQVTSDVKACLTNQYPDEHSTLLIHAPGSPQAEVEARPLHDLDGSPAIGPMTALFVPPTSPGTSFESFQETVAHLRAPDGCPWDREQTHLSLRRHMLDETYEVLDALDRMSVKNLREELGDLMLQLVIQVQIATEADEFQMTDVLAGINAKLIRRHPHVFGDVDVQSVSEVLHNWEALKEQERKANGDDAGSMDGVPASLPALAQAHEFQSRAARVGFDWPDIVGVLAKVDEEVKEVQAEGAGERQAAEMGDLLFALVNVARWLDIDAEAALWGANQRFKARFAKVEQAARSSGVTLSELGIEALESMWQDAKRQEAS